MGGLLRCADRRSDIPSALFAYCTYIGYDDGGCGNDTLLIWNRHSCWSGQASIRTPITRWSESQRHQVYLYLCTTNPRVKWGESYDLLVDSNPSSAAQHPRPGRDGVGLRHTKGQADQMNAVVVSPTNLSTRVVAQPSHPMSHVDDKVVYAPLVLRL